MKKFDIPNYYRSPVISKIKELRKNEDPRKKDLRWRIEHAQHLSLEDIPRFAKLGVIAAMQGIHCTSDATFVVERIGLKRAEEGAYVWKKLIDGGARFAMVQMRLLKTLIR